MARPRKNGGRVRPSTLPNPRSSAAPKAVTDATAPAGRRVMPLARVAHEGSAGPLRSAQAAAVNFALMQSAPDKYLDSAMLPPGIEACASSFSDTITVSSVADSITAQHIILCSVMANSFYQGTTIANGTVTAVTTTSLSSKASIIGVSTQIAHCAFGVGASTQGSTQQTLTYQAGSLPRRVGTTNDTNYCNTLQGVRDLLASEPYRSSVAGQSLKEDNLVVLVDGLYLGLQSSVGPVLNTAVPAQCITHVFTSSAAFQVLIRVYQRVAYLPTTASAPTAEVYAAPPMNVATYDIVKAESMRTAGGTSSTAESLKSAALRVAKEVLSGVGPTVLKGVGAVLRNVGRAVLPGWAGWILDVQHQSASYFQHAPSLRAPNAVSGEDEAKLGAWIESHPPDLRGVAAYSAMIHYELSGALGRPQDWQACYERASGTTRRL